MPTTTTTSCPLWCEHLRYTGVLAIGWFASVDSTYSNLTHWWLGSVFARSVVTGSFHFSNVHCWLDDQCRWLFKATYWTCYYQLIKVFTAFVQITVLSLKKSTSCQSGVAENAGVENKGVECVSWWGRRVSCIGVIILREYVFYVFSKSKKRVTFFWSVMSKKVRNVFQVFTFLHFEIATGHFRCKTITHTSCYTYNIILQESCAISQCALYK